MKSIKLLLILTLISVELTGQTPVFSWAKNIGDTFNDISYCVTTDATGNVYMTGSFEGTADFDPGPSTDILSSAGGDDIFFAKFDGSGNFLWAKRMGGTGDEYGRCINVDATGNIYVSGYFKSSTIDFDPGSGIFNLSTFGNEDIFISKYDASGNFIWAKNMGGSLTDYCFSSAVDLSGNIYSTGRIQATADMDPGTYFLTTPGGSDCDIFVSKLDSSGNFLWAINVGGTNTDQGTSITLDFQGNIILTGEFSRTADFDPDTGVFNLSSYNGTEDIFILKLNQSGNFIWAKGMGGIGSDIGNSISTDLSGSIYTTGKFLGTVDFDPGTNTFNLTANHQDDDVFISKLDSSGNFVWAERYGGTDIDGGIGITNDVYGNIYTIGDFWGAIDFDPGVGFHILDGYLTRNTYIASYDSSGNYLWAKSMEGNGTLVGCSIATDAFFNVYVSGEFSGTIDFDPDTGTYNLVSAGDSVFVSDIFLLKLNQLALANNEINLTEPANIYPNPSPGGFIIHLNISGNFSLSVFNIAGQLVSEKSFENVSMINYDIDSDPGFYVVELISSDKKITRLKVIKE